MGPPPLPVSAAGASDLPTLRIEYDVSDADLEAFYRRSTEWVPTWLEVRSKFRQMQRFWRITATIVACASVLAVVYAVLVPNAGTGTILSLMPLAFVSVYFVFKTSNRQIQARIDQCLRKSLDDPSISSYLGLHALELSPTGIRFDSPVGVLTRGWTAIAWIQTTPEFLCLHGVDGRGMFIPTRFLNGEAEALADRLRAWMIAEEGCDERRIGAMLAMQAFQCPACEHELYRTAGRACTACDVPLHRWNVQRPFQRRNTPARPA